MHLAKIVQEFGIVVIDCMQNYESVPIYINSARSTVDRGGGTTALLSP